MVRTLVFDLDDTLFAEREFVLSGFAAVDAWLREHEGLSGFFAEAERLFLAGRRGKIFDEVLAQLRSRQEPAFVEQLVAVYRDHVPRLTLLPDAREVLDWAVGKFELGLISDGFHFVQAKKLGALGIGDRFASCIFTDGLGREYWKPHPEAFRRTMARLGGLPADYVYIADNPRKDFIAPRDLGWKTVRVRRLQGEHHSYAPRDGEAADFEVSSLIELKALFRPVAG